jgi:hypothetical protein
MTIDVFMDFVGLVPREVPLDLLLYSRGEVIRKVTESVTT